MTSLITQQKQRGIHMSSNINKEESYWTAKEVAERYHVSIHAVWKWIREGKIRAIKIGRRSVRIPESSLVELEARSIL